MEKSGWMATRQTSQTPTSANNGTCALYSILNTHFMPLAKAKRLAARLLGRLPGQPAAMIGHRVDPTIAAIFDAYWYSRHAPKLAEGRPATPLFVIRSCRAIGSTSAVSRSLVSAQQSRRSGQRPQSACTLRQLWRKGRTRRPALTSTEPGTRQPTWERVPGPIRCCISSSTAPRLAISPTHTSIRSGTSSITRKQERPTLTR